MHNRIAVLGAEVNEAYQAELWRGISEESEKHSRQLICFMGSRAGSMPPAGKGSNPFYRLAHSGNFDGVIIIASAVSTYLEPAQVKSLFDSRPRIPKISIGLQLPGVGSVCVDGRDAMKKITEHLIIRHKRKHFAVIAGPHRHPESEQRRKALLEVLDSSGLVIEQNMQIHGTFEQSSGKAAMKQLLSYGEKIDAVVCLNDQMAIGAIEELTDRNISVPDRISVCGFDGIEESAYCSPPLTTVRQPLYQMGITAVRELYRLFEGGEPRDVTLACFPVIRQSCSCRLNTQATGVIQKQFTPFSPDETNQSIVDEAMLDSLISENRADAFLEEIEKLVNSSIFRPGDYYRLDEKLTRLESNLPDPYKVWCRTLGDAKRLLWETRTRYLINYRIQKKKRSDLLRGVGTSLTGAFELPELFRHLADGLRRLGFSHGFLVMYKGAGKQELPEFRLVFSLKNGEFVPDISVPFSNREVLPDITADLDAGDCMSWMFTPLVFQEQAIGHMLLPGMHPDTEIYDTLTRQIASSLQGAILLEQVRTHEKSLVREVRRRTKELTEVNRELMQEVDTRTRLEQEVIDISKHTMERIGQDLHDDLCQRLAGISLHVSALRCSIEKDNPDAVEVSDLISRLLSDAVTRTKRIIRGLLPLGIAEEGISDALEGLCNGMSVSSGMQIEYNRDNGINKLETERAIELYRIVQEAINNSIKHSGGTLVKVDIKTKFITKELQFSVIIQDNGRGFGNNSDSGGMGLKIMRYRGERAGIDVDIQQTPSGVGVICTGRQEFSNG